tara:strand:+ start:1006 stop:1434 length:429 start_codon:yes stop_codon:yes gene_type:complete
MDLQIFETDENYLREVYFRNLNETLSTFEHDLKKILENDTNQSERLKKYLRPSHINHGYKNLVRIGKRKFLWILAPLERSAQIFVRIEINDYWNVTLAEFKYEQFKISNVFEISDRNHPIIEATQRLLDGGNYEDFKGASKW